MTSLRFFTLYLICIIIIFTSGCISQHVENTHLIQDRSLVGLPGDIEIRSDGSLSVLVSDINIKDLSVFAGFPISILSISGTQVIDLSPVAGASLKRLNLANTLIADLSPLTKSKLTKFSCGGNRIKDLSPLAGLPIEEIKLICCETTTITALRGMKLKKLNITSVPICDISPLADMPLEFLRLANTSVSDLSPLNGMKIDKLQVINCPISSLTPLEKISVNELSLLKLPEAIDYAPLLKADIKVLYVSAENYSKISNILRGSTIKVIRGKRGARAEVHLSRPRALEIGDPPTPKGYGGHGKDKSSD